MQSCSRSSLGRWSMELLRGSMERSFFFFNKSGEQAVKPVRDKQTCTAGVGWLRHKPGLSLFLGAVKVFLSISGVAVATIQEAAGEKLKTAAP